jgi:hypothetical protein
MSWSLGSGSYEKRPAYFPARYRRHPLPGEQAFSQQSCQAFLYFCISL